MSRPTTPSVLRKSPQASLGFTLVELVVALAIVGILAAMAAPSMTKLMAGMAVDSQVQELATSLRLARSEALKRGMEVSVCSSSSGAACLTTPDWTKGWIVFYDYNGDGTLNTTGGDDAVIHAQSGSVHGVGSVSGAPSNLIFMRNGILLANAAATFDFKAVGSQASSEQVVCVNKQGRVQVKKGTGSCS